MDLVLTDNNRYINQKGILTVVAYQAQMEPG